MCKLYMLRLVRLSFLLILAGCYKDATQESVIIDPITKARQYVENNPQFAITTHDNDSNPFTAIRQLDWGHAALKTDAGIEAIWVPVHFPKSQYISISLDRHRLFNTNYIQQLRVWQDENALFHSELVSYFPDSNYVYGQPQFSGIVLVQDWLHRFIKEYKREKNGRITKMAQRSALTRSAHAAKNAKMIELCYYTGGYNYSDGVDRVYWELDLGCDVYMLEEGGHSTEIIEASYYWNSGGGSGGAYSAPPTAPNVTITGGNNIIGDIRDYTKCFDNIAGYGQHYSVTLCVAQPVPGTREPWGFTQTLPVASSADLVSAGHTFLILSQWDMVGRVTRNVGFYPKYSASPIQPVDQGQLADDEEHEYNISLTLEMNNSQFFILLDFISHGNDPGYNYDLNSNNCASFAIRALHTAGVDLQFNPGTWPGGGGFNPGELGEDIRHMNLRQGMSRSTEQSSHPNWGICY